MESRNERESDGWREGWMEGGKERTSGSTKLLMTEPRREQERLMPKAKASSFP